MNNFTKKEPFVNATKGEALESYMRGYFTMVDGEMIARPGDSEYTVADNVIKGHEFQVYESLLDPKPRMFGPNGMLTRYGLGCGYVESFTKISALGKGVKIKMYNEYEHYHFQIFKTGRGNEFYIKNHLVFDNHIIAKKAFLSFAKFMTAIDEGGYIDEIIL